MSERAPRRVTTTTLKRETSMHATSAHMGWLTRMTKNGARLGGIYGRVLVAHNNRPTLLVIR